MRLPQIFRLTRLVSADEDLSTRALELGRESYVVWRKRRMMALLVGLMESLSLTVFASFEIAVGMLPERLTYWAWGAAYLPIGSLLLASALALRRSSAQLDESRWRRALFGYRLALLGQAVYMVSIVYFFSLQLPLKQMAVIQFILLFMVVWYIVFLSLDRLASLVHPTILAPAIALSLYLDGVVDEAEGVAIVLGVLVIGLFYAVSALLRRILQGTCELEYDKLQQVAELKASGESMRLLARKYSVLVAEVGHDLRQPVQAISLAVRSLAETHGGAAYPLRTIEACATSLELALNSMLDYSRLSFGLAKSEPQSIELAPLFKRLEIEFAGAAHAKGVRLHVQSNDAVVLADQQALYRILGNLIQNALKFTHEGEVGILAVSAGPEWRLMVTDTGPGIPPERQAQIFEQFVSGDDLGEPASRGLGLGLAIAQRFAETMGTRLECMSQPQVGTQFSLRLPAARVSRRRARTPVDVQALAGRRVLLIDDDRFILDALAGYLGRQGLIVQASTHFDLPPFGDESPDLIVSDHFLDGLPLGLDGISKVRQRLGRPDLPAILLTGDVGVQISRSTEEMGVVLIHKPASPESLLAAIARLLAAAFPSKPAS
jgi:signal transduction histidine kinase/ActR/RegA family two-component response regulator